jgi:hypothetical protein
MVCLGNICINTLQKGAKDDDDDDDDDNNNNSNNNNNTYNPSIKPILSMSIKRNFTGTKAA